MKTLFEATTVNEVKQRMAHLRPHSERQWGKMNPAQAWRTARPVWSWHQGTGIHPGAGGKA